MGLRISHIISLTLGTAASVAAAVLPIIPPEYKPIAIGAAAAITGLWHLYTPQPE